MTVKAASAATTAGPTRRDGVAENKVGLEKRFSGQ